MQHPQDLKKKKMCLAFWDRFLLTACIKSFSKSHLLLLCVSKRRSHAKVKSWTLCFSLSESVDSPSNFKTISHINFIHQGAWINNKRGNNKLLWSPTYKHYGFPYVKIWTVLKCDCCRFRTSSKKDMGNRGAETLQAWSSMKKGVAYHSTSH